MKGGFSFHLSKKARKTRFGKKLKKIKKSLSKRLTGACKFGIIGRLCKYAVYGLIREVTEISREKPS